MPSDSAQTATTPDLRQKHLGAECRRDVPNLGPAVAVDSASAAISLRQHRREPVLIHHQLSHTTAVDNYPGQTCLI